MPIRWEGPEQETAEEGHATSKHAWDEQHWADASKARNIARWADAPLLENTETAGKENPAFSEPALRMLSAPRTSNTSLGLMKREIRSNLILRMKSGTYEAAWRANPKAQCRGALRICTYLDSLHRPARRAFSTVCQ